MKWIDYRELLKIGFMDNEKGKLFRNKISVLLDIVKDEIKSSIIDSYDRNDYEELVCRRYFITVCEIPKDYYAWYEVKNSIVKETELPQLISKSIAFVNSFLRVGPEKSGKYVKSYLFQALDDLNICYDLIKDDDGFFILPKGAKELDEANINTPFEWLKGYPEARKAMTDALEAYSNSDNYSNTADLFRKALECFSQIFFNSQKSLENLKSEYGQFMKQKGVPKELSDNFETVLQLYNNYMNNYAKHHDKTKKEYLEFIMYHTGNIIRFMISLAQ